MAADDKSLGLTRVEALRAGKQAFMWLTKDSEKVAVDGFYNPRQRG